MTPTDRDQPAPPTDTPPTDTSPMRPAPPNDRRTSAPPRWRLVVPAVWWAAILALSSIPQARFDPLGLPTWTNIVGHLVEYGVLGAALRWALPAGARRPVLTTVLVGLTLGGLDELWQSTVPGRHPSAMDLAVDLVALTLAAHLTHRWLAARGGTGVPVDR